LKANLYKLTAVNNGKTAGKNHRFYLKDSNIKMIENMRKKGESLKDAGSDADAGDIYPSPILHHYQFLIANWY